MRGEREAFRTRGALLRVHSTLGLCPHPLPWRVRKYCASIAPCHPSSFAGKTTYLAPSAPETTVFLDTHSAFREIITDSPPEHGSVGGLRRSLGSDEGAVSEQGFRPLAHGMGRMVW